MYGIIAVIIFESMEKFRTIDEYLAAQMPEKKEFLIQLHELILRNAKGVTEKISYGIPCFFLNGMLVGYNATKNGCSFYVMSTSLLPKLKAELGNLKFKGGTLYLNHQEAIPKKLLQKIIKQKVEQNALRMAAKKAKTKK